MVDPINAWWAQQLVLCGWVFQPNPTDLEPEQASDRLSQLGIIDRGELGWRLLEAFPSGTANPQQQLKALELLALAAAAAWLPLAQAQEWVRRLAREILGHYDSLDDWLNALRKARLDEGWTHGDEAFSIASEALACLEHEDAGITFELLTETVAERPDDDLWPAEEEYNVWRLRAASSPILALPMEKAFDWPGVAGWLQEVWQIHDREELIRTLLWLAGQGQRYGWDTDAARLLEQDAQARQEWLARLNEQQRYGRVLLSFLEHGETLEWAAWDWLRLVDLAYAGKLMGWLDSGEAEAFAAHAADLLARRYSDWVALSQAYQRGRSLFEGVDHRPNQASDWALLLHSPVSPWRIPLQKILSAERREASHRAIRAWRGGAYHWVLALASIREADLLHRQGYPISIDRQRREDARRYLTENLGLTADEGVAGLARYWLPAQSHHLNQLAADAVHNALPSLDTGFGRPPAEVVALRDGLKSCSRHAATIHMAEKFAFHLLMAGDSGDFDAQGRADMAESLRGVLCRLYGDSKRLLKAWAEWESALPEFPDDTLAHEIRWHHDDPGSPFHWLDWQQAAWREPGPRPTLSCFTALALSGPLGPGIWGEPQREGAFEREAIRQWLDSHYGLHSASAISDFLNFLLEAGDRQEYQVNYAPYTLNQARLEEEIAILESGDCGEEERNHLLRLQRVRANEASCNDVDMTAWDLAQAVDLAIAGRSLDWLSKADFVEILEQALALAKRHYGDWRDYARGMYAGFSFFMGETEERENFLDTFRKSLMAWLSGAPPLAGAWASLDFPGARPRHWSSMHIDTLPENVRTLH